MEIKLVDTLEACTLVPSLAVGNLHAAYSVVEYVSGDTAETLTSVVGLGAELGDSGANIVG